MTVSLVKTFPAAACFFTAPVACTAGKNAWRMQLWCWVCAYAPFVCRFQLLGLVALCTTCVLLSVILLFAWSSWQVIISKLARPRSVQLWVMWKECELLPNINDLLCVRYTDRRGKKKNDFITWKVTWFKSSISISGQISFLFICHLYANLDLLEFSFNFTWKMKKNLSQRCTHTFALRSCNATR